MQPAISLLFTILFFFVSSASLLVLLFLSSRRIHRIYSRLDAREHERRIRNIGPHVQEGDTVLDIGAGTGRFGEAVQERLKARVMGVEVTDYIDGAIPVLIYDGKKLPFPDNSFDVAILAFVLHHTHDQKAIMKEACRVARRQIIVLEDTYDWIWERLFVCWNDYHTNILQGAIKARRGFLAGDPSGMPMPLTFRSIRGWSDFMDQFPLESISYEVRKMGYKPLKKVTFCLTLEQSPSGTLPSEGMRQRKRNRRERQIA